MADDGPRGSSGTTKHAGVRAVAVNAAHLWAGQVLTILARVIYIVLVARSLGPELFGLFAYAQSWAIGFAPLTILGLRAVMLREIGREPRAAAPVVARALTLTVAFSALTIALAIAVGWRLEPEPLARWLLVLFSLALLGRGLEAWANGVFVGHGQSRYTLRQAALFRLLDVAVGLSVLLAGGGALGLALAHTLVWWMQAARSVFLVHRDFAPARPDWDPAGLRPLLRPALGLGLVLFLSSWLLQGPVILYRHLAENAALIGQLGLAMQAPAIAGGLPRSIASAAAPVLSRSVRRADGKDVAYVEAMLRLGIILGAAVAVIASAAGPALVTGIFGSRYAVAGELLGPVLWLLIPLTASGAMASVLIARGVLRELVALSLVAVLLLVGAAPPLVSILGTWGMLLAAGLALCAHALGRTAILARQVRLDLGLALIRPCGVVAAALAVGLLLERYGPGVSVSATLLVLLAGTLNAGVLRPGEKRELTALIRGVFSEGR